jgi:hypothetical protein
MFMAPLPLSKTFSSRAPRPPHYAQKIGEKTKTDFTVSTVLGKKRSTVKVGGFAHFCYFRRPGRGGVGNLAKKQSFTSIAPIDHHE